MTRLTLLFTLVSLSALADVGPRPAACNVAGKGCTTCDLNAGEPPGVCEASAQDAGLVLSDCTDRSGALLHTYYCPKGTSVARSSCAAVPPEVVPFAGLLLLALRRRRGGVTHPEA
jgi:hypothetical protein